MTRTAIGNRLYRLRTRVQVVRSQVNAIRDIVALSENGACVPDEELVIQLGESVEALNVAMRCLRPGRQINRM